VIRREQILALIPHAGSMCLIGRVANWTEDEIHCETDDHRDAAHPLRRTGGLSAMHLIEYGAQAAAIHGALLAPDHAPAKRSGMLIAVHDCELFVDYLHDLPHVLKIHARREASSSDALMYSFDVAHGGQPVGRGRLTIRLAAAD
jgi:predicted hotdog family 3-hydroxylacyl-ACP dehydratase